MFFLEFFSVLGWLRLGAVWGKIGVMDFKKVKKLIKLIEQSGVSEIEIEEDGLKIKVKKDFGGQVQLVSPAVSAPSPVVAEAPQEAVPVDSDAGLLKVESPMVGTFYSAANPESPAFVKVGDQIGEGDVVCIVEAMKLFNEIESDVSGTVEKVLVQNGDPIEYGQALFLIRP